MLDVFEKKVLVGLKSCGVELDSVSSKSPLGIAVSGGADSVSLLISLASIFDSSFLRVITVNHGIRSEEESGGDAAFVKELCKKYCIKCYVETIGHGKITELAKNYSASVESVARELRYKAFESFIKNENIIALCLAHNQNDQCETLLMRFLQGSGTEGLGGIEHVRGKYIRPLLEISRFEIEHYLSQKKQSWRTDATNSDTNYLRNRIRNVLVPVLNENFLGWQKSVLLGAKKSRLDEKYLMDEMEKLPADLRFCNDSELVQRCSIDRKSFYKMHPALQRRVFFESLNKIGFGSRFPYRVFEQVISWKEAKLGNISFEDVRVSLDSESLVIELSDDSKISKNENLCIGSGFCFVLKNESDSFELENLAVRVQKSSDNRHLILSIAERGCVADVISFPVALPLIVRTPLPGDEIQTARGNFKSLSDVFNDWKIPKNQRDKILVVENLSSGAENFIKAALAFHLGFKNWIVE